MTARIRPARRDTFDGHDGTSDTTQPNSEVTPITSMRSSSSSRRTALPFLAGLTAFLLGSPGSILAQQQTSELPKPGPEQKKLEVWVGEWNYEGSGPDTVMGPGGSFKGKSTSRMTMGGLFLESRWADKGTYGGKVIELSGLDLMWFDAPAKGFAARSFCNDGSVASGTATVDGSTWTTLGSRTAADGQLCLTRDVSTYSADGKTRTSRFEFSTDGGQTWTLWFELTAQRTRK